MVAKSLPLFIKRAISAKQRELRIAHCKSAAANPGNCHLGGAHLSARAQGELEGSSRGLIPRYIGEIGSVFLTFS